MTPLFDLGRRHFLCVTIERRIKCSRVMQALWHGMRGKSAVVHGPPPDTDDPIIVWGQRWLPERVLPRAIENGRHFAMIDNGWFYPSAGKRTGYHRITLNGVYPVHLKHPPPARFKFNFTRRPLTKGGHIVIALPGNDFGQSVGMNMAAWSAGILERVRQHTDRRIIVRDRLIRHPRPIEDDLRGALALVTHSSNAAVDALRLGVPVFVDPASHAAPVGNTDLSQIENPWIPDPDQLDRWARSLMAQQFTLQEMQNGTAARMMRRAAEEWDEQWQSRCSLDAQQTVRMPNPALSSSIQSESMPASPLPSSG